MKQRSSKPARFFAAMPLSVSSVCATLILLIAAITVSTAIVGCESASFYMPNEQAGQRAASDIWHQTMPRPLIRPSTRGRSQDDATTSSDADFTRMIGEELWVIARPSDEAVARAKDTDDAPGSGAMLAVPIGASEDIKPVPMPLRHTAVDADILGYIASVDVTQQFHNPYSEKIEAVYVFPLPHDAAVNEFVMTIGERRIRGIIREREEAQRIYHDARSRGHVASLLTQERPNIFTQKVANIEPGKQIDVNIRYFHTLAFDDGWYEFVFPMVVGPRYNPAHITDGIGAVPRGGHGSSGQSTEVQYLRPNERSGHDISVTVNVDAGVELEKVVSMHHRLNHTRDGRVNSFTLADADRVPNKDLVLRYRVAGDTIRSNLVTYRDDAGDSYFTLMLYPPAELSTHARRPMEMVFVVDCSGSMSGKPINQARAAIRHALSQLQPNDTFHIILFSNNASTMSEAPLPATAANIRRGLKFINSTQSGGGTEMMTGIRAALDFPHDHAAERQRIVTFLTDGYIGNEREILHAIHEKLGPTRIFSFGVGTSTNRWLLDQMALVGNGAVAYLSIDDDAAAVMDAYFQRISRPAMTNIKLDFGNAQLRELYPSRQRDLFVGRPLIVTGRVQGALPERIRVTGLAHGEEVAIELPVDDEQRETHQAVRTIWARHKIAELTARSIAAGRADDYAPQILQVALENNLMSAYTAFLAVDASQITEGSHGTTVNVAVPVPEGVRYETTVLE